MSATDSELTSMEEHPAVEDKQESRTNVPSTATPATIASSPPPFPTTTRPDFTSELVIENKAVSMASADCSSTLSSPAEASPAKPAETSPTIFEGSVESSTATSHIASDSLTCTETNLVNISESLPSSCVSPPTIFGNPDLQNDFPAVLTFNGISVTLENNSVWKQFYSCGTEMILTKQGRRMFPYCRYRLAGLDPERLYSLVLSIVPSDQNRYRWSTSKWEVTGRAEHQGQGLSRAFSHHYSPCRGSEWMSSLVSFYKLKLTNNLQDQEGHIILHSMHRYIPRLHVIPVPEGVVPSSDKPVVMVIGPESITFTFPQTEFMAVTTYQNFRITQLKINHNPFAKGFRDDGNNFRLQRVTVAETDTLPSVVKCPEPSESKEGVVNHSMENHTVSASLSNAQETRLVLKPIMSTSANKDEPYVPCIRGKHALGELVLVEKQPLVESKKEDHTNRVTPESPQGFTLMPRALSVKPTSLASTPGSKPGYRRRRKRINRHWANSRGRVWSAAAASPMVVHSPSLTVAMQPELDDVEGLLFVSFTSKEALDVHKKDKPASSSPSVSPVHPMTLMHLKQTEVIPETAEEKIARLEVILLQDLRVLKHRQVIHPVLQEVGLKLNSLDHTKSIDLQYLGVHLPLPPPKLPEQSKAADMSTGDEELPFISRTGKTSDMTKIKGWRNKFLRSKEGLQKNLSAFCSNMLDEYLESEAKQISERAAAFSTNPDGSVAYQLPAKSSSYIKTLDSVLKHRNAASRLPIGANRPCPLSYKPLLYSTLMSPPPPLSNHVTPVQAEAQSVKQSTSSHMQPETVLTTGENAASESAYTCSAAQRLSTYQSGISQKPTLGFGVAHRPSGLTKFQFRLLQMETEALNQGLSRTQLTQDRLSVALSVMLTKQMLPSQVLKLTQYPKYKAVRPECGQEFCRLGCVCYSLQHPSRVPLHCRRPECMFGCACLKSLTKAEHVAQTFPGCHTNKLWNHNIHDVDPEPLFTPTPKVLSQVLKRSTVPHQVQPIREEDKDPVYKYLESMMTCARVREFNSKPPPVVTIEPKIFDSSAANTAVKQQTTTSDNLPKQYYRTVIVKNTEKTSQESADGETEARKQIQIQSGCDWSKDRKMVLETLCRRMNQNRLTQCFYIGPYRIRPIAKIFVRKPSGSIVIYRVRITKPSKASDNDEDEFDDSDEEKHTNKSFELRDSDAEEDDDQFEEPVIRFGVTPFMGGILPAGRLRARTKPSAGQTYGLIQVNGKSYNQARLLLGSMGSLHPANRLAAYVTGRLHGPSTILQKNSKQHKNNIPSSLHIKTAGTVIPPIITAKKTDLKTSTQPPGQLFQQNSYRNEAINLSQHSQNSSDLSQRSLVHPSTNTSTSSPVSLTVSPSLKTPSFLAQSGTYSFRICPPANQSTRGQNLPGVTLPGGFTLIQLPKPGGDGAMKQSENMAEPGFPPKLICDEKMPSDDSDKAYNRQVVSKVDIASEDLSSSDCCGDGDEDEEPVDIETVEDEKQGMAIAKMKEAVMKALQESRRFKNDFDSAREQSIQDQMNHEDDKSVGKTKRRNHTVLERQRRSEQRTLFDKLQIVLQSNPRAPRLSLLSLAVREIQNLVETSKRLEEQKKRLMQMHCLYVKQLSFLSGKSENLIKYKLREISERQKTREKTMKWRPFFSHLLQSRAALLQASASKPNLQPMPLLQPNFNMATFQPSPPTPAAQQNVHQMRPLLQFHLQKASSQSGVPQSMTVPHSVPQPVSSPAQVGVNTAPSLVENQPAEPAASGEVGLHQSKLEDQQKAPEVGAQITKSNSQSPTPSVLATFQVPAVQDTASPASSTAIYQPPPAQPTPPFTLPLIRSKTGRLILPSSLKPIGSGFYTLMVMKAKQKEEEGEISSAANQPTDSESSRILKEDKTAPSDSDPKHSGTTYPLAEIAFLNKSICIPSLALQSAEKSQDESTVAGLIGTLGASCLRSMQQSTASVETNPDPNPPVVCRRRGRPRKHPLPPVNEKHTVLEETRKSVTEIKTVILFEERRSAKSTLKVSKRRAEDTQTMVCEVADNPVPVKRGRGRPPKKKPAELCSPSVAQAGNSSSKSNEDSPVRHSCRVKSPNSKPRASPGVTTSPGDNTSRPLTRGALGKDFPSAKKRSWIDVEKELEPDLDSE
ncbi:MAX gene-associated protein isoform X2 [Mastacembelus armatus]|uniref:MAX gene-associated protein isoform X2 n=1 Tax=Mastacembelus armatus TaxID=205130 RepID=UPI000E45DD28|nr:MAX gene-associated protein-like isoform X2 [Mastacembelus armatus]